MNKKIATTWCTQSLSEINPTAYSLVVICLSGANVKRKTIQKLII